MSTHFSCCDYSFPCLWGFKTCNSILNDSTSKSPHLLNLTKGCEIWEICSSWILMFFINTPMLHTPLLEDPTGTLSKVLTFPMSPLLLSRIVYTFPTLCVSWGLTSKCWLIVTSMLGWVSSEKWDTIQDHSVKEKCLLLQIFDALQLIPSNTGILREPLKAQSLGGLSKHESAAPQPLHECSPSNHPP